MIEITEEQREIQSMVREFAVNELAPQAAAVDASGEYPGAAWSQLAELGLLGAPVPEQYGGIDGNSLLVALILEEIGGGCASTAMLLAGHVAQVTAAIVDHGTEAQKERLLPGLAAGERLAAFALAEHGAEADAGAVACTVSADGDGWILDGVKKYVIGGGEAGIYLVVAHTGGGSGTEDLAMFLVEGGAEADGVRLVGVEDALGLRGARVAEVAFEACRLPADARLGGADTGFDAIRRVLESGRIGAAAIACGVARSAVDYARVYASQRHAFGTTVDSFEAIRNMFADAATSIEAGRLLTYSAACRRDAGEPFAKEASMAKLFACDAAYVATKSAVQILGGNGYSREYPVERMFRDAKTLEVVEATGELHRRLIARAVLGESA